MEDAVIEIMILQNMLNHMETKMRSKFGDAAAEEIINEVAKETTVSMLDAVGADSEFRGFTHANLDGIVNGTVDFSDFLDFKMNGGQGTGS